MSSLPYFAPKSVHVYSKLMLVMDEPSPALLSIMTGGTSAVRVECQLDRAQGLIKPVVSVSDGGCWVILLHIKL